MNSDVANRNPPGRDAAQAVALFGTAPEREEIRRLVEKERALRDVADLIARAGADVDIIAIIVREASRQIHNLPVTLTQFVSQRELLVLASPDGPAEAGMRIVFEADTLPDRVLRTGRPFRVDDYRTQPNAEMAADFGNEAGVGVPIVVEGRVWGMFNVMSSDGPLPSETEDRIAAFAQLVTASFDSIEARSQLRAVAEHDEVTRWIQQEAAASSISDVATSLVSYAAKLGGIERATLTLNGGVVASAAYPVVSITNSSVRPTQNVAFPVISQEQEVGLLTVETTLPTLPDQTTQYLTDLSEVTGRIIAASTNRQHLSDLVDEQASLRHIAELAARGVPLPDLFKTVVNSTVRLFGARVASLSRLTGVESQIVARAANPEVESSNSNIPNRDAVTAVKGMPFTRLDLPITVEDQAWGVLTVEWATAPAEGTANRLKPFANITAIAIANADYREGLTRSRARIIAAGDDARRRLQRDVHDGAQQRIVHAILNLKVAREKARAGEPIGDLLDEAIRNAEDTSRQLRDVVRGILPAALTRAGLVAGIESFVADIASPVQLNLDIPRLPAEVEVTGYFVVAEALTNAVKHANATALTVTARITKAAEELIIVVADNGIGGADPAGGSGLTGLMDRVEAGFGTLEVLSPIGGGTTITARFPLRLQHSGAGIIH